MTKKHIHRIFSVFAVLLSLTTFLVSGAAGAMSVDEFLRLCESGSLEEIRSAILDGANVNAKNNDGMTALMVAAGWGRATIIAELIKAGADVNAKNKDNYTALMYAAGGFHLNPEVVIMLIKAGSDVNVKGKNGYTALDFALESSWTGVFGAPEALHLLESKTTMRDKDFIELCKFGPLDRIRTAIQAGTNVNAKDGEGTTALMIAAKYNRNPEVITTLIKAGAEVNIKNRYGQIAIDFALENGNLKGSEALKLLETKTTIVRDEDFIALCKSGPLDRIHAALQTGSNVNAKDKNGKTALMWAAGNNKDSEVVTVLIKSGADVKAKDKDSRTALAYAAGNNQNPKVITALIEAGADVNVMDNAGMRSLDYALKNKALKGTDALKLLDEKTRMNDVDFVELCKSGSLARIRAAIQAGSDVNADSEGLTLLMWTAVSNKDPEVITALIKAGANLSATDEEGMTILMGASGANANPEVITALLKAGADINETDQSGATALMWAARYNPNPEAVTTLIKAGADINARDADNMKALDFALENDGLKGSEALRLLTEKTTVAIERLAGEFIENPFFAEEERQGKPITIDGQIAALGTDKETKKPMIVFEHFDGDTSVKIKCFVSKKDPLLTKVSKGKRIVIQGTVSSFDGAGLITIDDCKIVR